MVLLRTVHKTRKWEGELDSTNERARGYKNKVFLSSQRVVSVKDQIRGLVAMGVWAIMTASQHDSQAFMLFCLCVFIGLQKDVLCVHVFVFFLKSKEISVSITFALSNQVGLHPQSHSRWIMYLRYPVCLSFFAKMQPLRKHPMGKKYPSEKDLLNQGLFPLSRELIKSCVAETKPTNPFAQIRTDCAHASVCLYQLR